MPVNNKLHPHASDQMCNVCSQQWQGECRAFQMPHSAEEREARSASLHSTIHSPRTPCTIIATAGTERYIGDNLVSSDLVKAGYMNVDHLILDMIRNPAHIAELIGSEYMPFLASKLGFSAKKVWQG